MLSNSFTAGRCRAILTSIMGAFGSFVVKDDSLLAERLNLVKSYPLLRYMGSKYRLLGWIAEEVTDIEFETVLDAFSGSAAVSYLFKGLGKQVYANDFLHFAYVLAKGTVENSASRIDEESLDKLLSQENGGPTFIQDTFRGVFYTDDDLAFLDHVSYNIRKLKDEHVKALALSCLIRSCVKKQPRGVFTISGDTSKYDDGRRDLRLSIRDHFLEQISQYNATVFDNGKNNLAFNLDVFEFDEELFRPDLVYLDPPYVPRSDDNCYVKRYHFLEGLSKYWQNEEIMYNTKVKKIKKKYTPFSYRRTALEAFDRLFAKFAGSTIMLSYSSNGYPDVDTLSSLLKKYKRSVNVRGREHRYHFGTHGSVRRAKVDEYLIVGTDT